MMEIRNNQDRVGLRTAPVTAAMAVDLTGARAKSPDALAGDGPTPIGSKVPAATRVQGPLRNFGSGVLVHPGGRLAALGAGTGSIVHGNGRARDRGPAGRFSASFSGESSALGLSTIDQPDGRFASA